VDIVQRVPAVARLIEAKHKPPTRAQARKAHASSKPGTLIVTIVSASIFDGELQHAAPPVAGHLFVVTVAPEVRGRSRTLEKQGQTLAPVKLSPGRYRIDVAEDPSTGLLQAYPAGASEAVIESGKTTSATVVLANDPLRNVAEVCDFRIGVQVRGGTGAWGQAMLETLRTEFNVAEIGQYWESVQTWPPPPSSPLSAPIVKASTDLATVLEGLAKNGWSAEAPVPAPPPPGLVFNERCWQAMDVGGAPGFEIMPTPIAWLNFGQAPSWFQPPWFQAAQAKSGTPVKPPPPVPPLHLSWPELLHDHVRTMMLLTQRLQRENAVYPWVAPPVYAWVLVNEAFDSTGSTEDLRWWSGKSYKTSQELEVGRADLVRTLLDVAHGVDKKGLLLVNDFTMEFFPPPRSGNTTTKASAAARQLGKSYGKARVFYRMMSSVLKNSGALRGHVGVGYQMHFPYGDQYYADMSVYRAALQRGIRLYRRRGVPVVITEMVVLGNHYPDDPTTYAERKYSSDPTNPAWRTNAAVYRDIIKTYFLEPGCHGVRPGVSFWGLYDEAGDEPTDWYGHLYDVVLGADGVTFSAMNRKPSYFAVLNGLIDAVHQLRGQKVVPNWMRHCPPG
jgi:hypothetical protein